MHPTPQRRRQQWLDLTGTWGFAYDDDDAGLVQGWQSQEHRFGSTITVPFPPESSASGIGDAGFHPVVWYRRTLRLADLPGWSAGQRVRLHFGAVDHSAHVWVNGQLIGTHEGGHTSFVLDVTPALRGQDEQVLVVRAFDSPTDLSQPRGKQYWEAEPGRVWYHRTTGIWQQVWAEVVGDRFLAVVDWTSDVSRGLVGVEATLDGEPRGALSLRVRLSLRGRVLSDDVYGVTGRQTRREIGLPPFFLNSARRELLWSPAHPNLLDAELVLQDASGDVLDRLHSYVGVRSVEAADDFLLLNGMPEYLRMVLSQGYWPQSHLAAPSAEALTREVALVKQLGFNGVRVHQKIEDPRFLYECDRQGVLVWAEMPSAYAFDATAVRRTTAEWMEAVRRDISCPSIVAWVPFNESWGVPHVATSAAQEHLVRGLYSLTRAVDPSRPVIGNDGWEHVQADIWGVHDYGLTGAELSGRWGSDALREQSLAGRPLYPRVTLDAAARSGQPVVITEMGGISYHADPEHVWHGYGSATSPEGVLAAYDDLVGSLLASPSLAGFCYTQLTDTEQESNGLVDVQRRPKVAPELIAEVNRRPSRALPAERLVSAQSAAAAP